MWQFWISMARFVSATVRRRCAAQFVNWWRAGTNKILLNLKGVRYIDSSGIGELIANFTTVNRGGGQLKLLNLTEKVQDLLVITKLLTVFDVYDNEAEALNSFK